VRKQLTKYQALALTTSYWQPGENYKDKIIRALESKIENGDLLFPRRQLPQQQATSQTKTTLKQA